MSFRGFFWESVGFPLRFSRRSARFPAKLLETCFFKPPKFPKKLLETLTQGKMPRRRKTASSRVSGLLRTQRRCRRAFSLPPVRIWARRTAQTRSSGFFLENPAVFCYFWNETAVAKTAGLSPAAAPGPVGCHSEHADTSWVCAQAVRNARTAAFCDPNSVFWRHISGPFLGAFRWRVRAQFGSKYSPNW